MSSLKEQLQKEPSIASLPHVDRHVDEFKKGVYQVTDGVYIAIGYAIANSICVETRTGLVIVDVLEEVGAAREVCKEFKRLTSNKPIKSIIFTHAHFDHVAGIKGFIENEKEEPTIYLHQDCMDHERRNVMFKYGIGDRSLRQFGTILKHQLPINNQQKNWYKNAGLGESLRISSVLDDTGEIIKEFEHSMANMASFHTFGDSCSFYQDEMKFEMIAAFGETDNQILIHVPSKSLLLPGDNIYRAFPNIYAIRGVDPRDAYAWYSSIETMLDYVETYNIQHLAPSHSRHIVGYRNIMDILTIYRDGISFVHDQTIRYLNQGYSQDEIVKQIQQNKPDKLFKHPYLLEHYGTIEWSVRAIYTKNMGWFSGKVCDLFPCSHQMKSNGIMSMMQFIACNKKDNKSMEHQVIEYIELEHNTNQRQYANDYNQRDLVNRWLLELTTQLMMKMDCTQIREIRYQIIRDMASYQTSSPARNYLLSCWLEEKYDIELTGSGNFSDIIKGRPIEWTMRSLPFHVDPVKCKEIAMITGIIELCDIEQIYRLRLKDVGVMQLTLVDGYDVKEQCIDWILRTEEKRLKYMLANAGNTKGEKKEVDKGHMIPRIRTGSGGLIGTLFAIVAGKEAAKNGLIKGQLKAIQFFRCLEYNVISKL
eukprot:93200_1